jgi:hypothetical protein
MANAHIYSQDMMVAGGQTCGLRHQDDVRGDVSMQRV